MDNLLSATTYLSQKIGSNTFQSLQQHRYIINEIINGGNSIKATIPPSPLPSSSTDDLQPTSVLNNNNNDNTNTESLSKTRPNSFYFDYNYYNLHMNVLNQMTIPAGSRPNLFDVIKIYILSMKYPLWIKTLFQTFTTISFCGLISIYLLKIILPLTLSNQNQQMFSYILSSSSSLSLSAGSRNSNSITESFIFKLFIVCALVSTYLSRF